MAPKLSFFSIFLVLVMLLFSQVLARDLMNKKQDGKDFDLGITEDYRSLPDTPNAIHAWSVPPPPDCDSDCPGEEEVDAGQFKGKEQQGH